MKTLYFDLIGGISGDMTLAALLDLGVPWSDVRRLPRRLGLSGVDVTSRAVERGHARARHCDVVVKKPRNFSYAQIVRRIERSGLSRGARERALKVYRVLRDAEIKAHGHAHAGQRFEQLGDTDSVFDITAVCMGLDHLGCRELLYGPIPLCQRFGPATGVLLEGKRVVFQPFLFENVTPTGMAVLAALGRQAQAPNAWEGVFGRCGYGAGTQDPPGYTNVLRIVSLEQSVAWERDRVWVLEANIDDMNPQFFEDVFDRLFAAGALDVAVTNLVMKKSRPGFLLTVLSRAREFDKIARIVLEGTSTTGLRYREAGRLKWPRAHRSVTWLGNRVRCKVCATPGVGMKIVPEYDDCRVAARRTGRPLRKVYENVRQQAETQWRSQD
jgi:uncharacterized protein (TIGR00299 family) protein